MVVVKYLNVQEEKSVSLSIFIAECVSVDEENSQGGT